MNKSVWTDRGQLPKFDSFFGDKSTDVLIIGGGICGILCAYFLDRLGIDYILLEGSRICSGITKNTTAKITSQHGLIYDKLIKSVGEEKANMYLEANQQAVIEFEKLCRDIDCDFEWKPSYVYTMSDRKKAEREVTAVNRLGFAAEFCDSLPLPFETEGAVKFKNQAQFNPLKFIASIAKGLNIYENSFVRHIENGVASTNMGSVKADKIIVATHFPFINRHGSYFIKLYQHRSYVIAFDKFTDIYGDLDGMYIDESDTGLSFRKYNDLMFIGGGGHRTGKNGGNWNEIREFAKSHYGDINEKYTWSTQDCMSLDGIPYIGHYSKNTENMYTATGFNKWGMTSSMAAAKILCDMVQGIKNEYEDVFSPSRSILKPQLMVNGYEAVKNLIMPKTKRCPHMGCALVWNKTERSWDCPCHGSRFSENGSLIDNPATGGLNESH